MSQSVTRRNDGDAWDDDEIQELRELAKGNTPTGVISVKLGRSEKAIRSKASAEGISLAPANPSPYGDVTN